MESLSGSKEMLVSITWTCTPCRGRLPGRVESRPPAARFRSLQGVHGKKKDLERLSSLSATRIQKLRAWTSGYDRPSFSFPDFFGKSTAVHVPLSLSLLPAPPAPHPSSLFVCLPFIFCLHLYGESRPSARCRTEDLGVVERISRQTLLR